MIYNVASHQRPAKTPMALTNQTVQESDMAAPIILQCAICGQDFRVRPSYASRRKTCSKKCMGIFATNRMREFGTRKRPPEDRFWEKVDKTPGHGPNGDCWVWTGKRTRGGYGLLYRSKKNDMYRAHVFSYRLNNGEIPDGLWVCHECDNPACVRPDHLWLGTAKENSIDMVLKGRDNPPRGEKCHLSKLKEGEVRSIISDPRSCAVIAAEYGIGKTTVANIKKRLRWAHLEV